MGAAPATVNSANCASCEAEWQAVSKETEAAERARLDERRATDMKAFLGEVWDYYQHTNDTQRQELALVPDMELRRFVIDSSTPPTPLMDKVYSETMQRVPYEQSCYICGPEQAILLRALVATARPRHCLDIGCFTGFASSGVLDALPADAKLTCIDNEPTWTEFAGELFNGARQAEFVTADAMETLRGYEAEGRRFDLITLDADKPMHGEYYNASLRLLRPQGVIIMFGMLLFPTLEDQQAMERMHELLPNDTRINTAQFPLGCGIQFMVKQEGTEWAGGSRYWRTVRPDGTVHALADEPPLEGAAAELEMRRYALESELEALQRLIDSDGYQLGGVSNSGPGTEALSSSGLVALAAARRAAQEAAEQEPPVEDG